MKSDNRYDSLIQYYAWEQGFFGDYWLRFKAQIRAESNFKPDAVSSVGAKGLAQFMLPTWGEWGHGQRENPEENIDAQVKYMKWILKRVGGDWDRAFAAYNWGIGRMMKLADDPHWKTKLPLETKEYIKRIEQYYQKYLEEKEAV